MESSKATALLVITGSMGSGKSTVMAEASDILAARGVFHAAIDLDALGVGHFCSHADSRGLVDHNLRCVWDNFAARGATRLLLAAAVENREDLEGCRAAVRSGKTVVCRLTAAVKTMQQRIRAREIGVLQQKFVDRVAVLDKILDGARLEDFSVVNENRLVTEVAQEMLLRAGWMDKAPEGFD
jgi:predicted kinase